MPGTSGRRSSNGVRAPAPSLTSVHPAHHLRLSSPPSRNTSSLLYWLLEETWLQPLLALREGPQSRKCGRKLAAGALSGSTPGPGWMLMGSATFSGQRHGALELPSGSCRNPEAAPAMASRPAWLCPTLPLGPSPVPRVPGLRADT